MRLAIQGSCVSRDTYEFKGLHDIELVRYGARSSFAIANMPKLKIPYDTKNLISNFQQRMVRDDHQRNFPNNLENCSFDILLIDLIDERFDLININNKGIVTNSNEFQSTDEFKKAQDIKRIKAHSNKHAFLILQGLDILFKKLNEIGKINSCYLNKVYYAKYNELGDHIKMSDNEIDKANNFLKKMYIAIENFFPNINSINYDNNDFIAKSDHKWGEAPFHYIDSLYIKTIKKILENYQE